MARISTVYDKDIKEQVFMVRGDERYARSTKTTISLGNPVLHSENFDLPMHVNVFRDVAQGNLVVYDNDLPFMVIDDWESTDNGRDILLESLNYDVAHNVYVKYVGNGKCSPSSSKIETIDIKNPYVFDSSIDVILPSIYDGSMTGIQIMLFNTESVDYNQNQDLQIYYDDTLIATENTGNTGSVLTNISNVGRNGIHELKVVFEGSNHLTPCTKTVTVNVGYKLEIVDAPSVGAYRDVLTFKVKLTDFLNTPIPNSQVQAYSVIESTEQYLTSALTNAQGIATISSPIQTSQGNGDFIFKNNGADDSEIVHVRMVNVTSLYLSANSDKLFIDQENVLTGRIDSNIEGVPVKFTEYEIIDGTAHSISTEIIHTNAYGNATKTIKGDGGKDKYWQVDCGGQSAVKQFKDYRQYWAIPDEFNVRQYTLSPPGTAQLLTLQSYFQIYCTQMGYYYLYINTDIQKPFETIHDAPYTFVLEEVRSKKTENGRYLPIMFEKYSRSGDTQRYELSGDNSKIVVTRDENGTVYVKDSAGHNYSISNQEGNPVVLVFMQTTTFTKLSLRHCVEEEA